MQIYNMILEPGTHKSKEKSILHYFFIIDTIMKSTIQPVSSQLRSKKQQYSQPVYSDV